MWVMDMEAPDTTHPQYTHTLPTTHTTLLASTKVYQHPTPQQNPQPQSKTPAPQWQPIRNPIAGHTQTITPSLHPATAAIPQLPSIPSYWLPSTKPSLQLHPTIPTTTIHIPNHNTIPKLPLTIQAILTSHQHKKPSPP